MRYSVRKNLGLLVAVSLWLALTVPATRGQAVAETDAPVATEIGVVDVVPQAQPSTPAAALAHEDLDATLWMQTSSEYRATCLQIYRAAIHHMGQALVDPTATAAIEQRAAMLDPDSCAANLPPAVILDVDETVLDNSGFQAQLIATGEQYSPAAWAEWTSDVPAIPIPGVKEFLDTCQAAGVTPIFVTNRSKDVKAATRANLEKYDLISPESTVDTLLCKQDRDTWTSDKSSRRAHIAKSYRILLLIGDDLNDFVSVGIKPTPSARRSLAEEHASNWGTKWFMIPNPNYGGWERAIHGWRDESARETKLKLKRDLLRLEPPDHL